MTEWTAAHEATLERLCKAKAPTQEILDALPGFTRPGIIGKWNRMGFRRREFQCQRVYKPVTRKKRHCRGWTKEEVDLLVSMRQMQPGTDRPCAFHEIGKRLNRSCTTVRAKWIQISRGHEPRALMFPVERPAHIPQSVITERDHAYDNDARDHTAITFGDPRPGRSALDRRASA